MAKEGTLANAARLLKPCPSVRYEAGCFQPFISPATVLHYGVI
jgi:hypothetical protein